nr:MAG TPA: LexA repressor [Caudoviricetes sp.]
MSIWSQEFHIGQIAAGKPILADEHIEAFLPCDTGVHADFGLVVSGDSMIGADIHDGDVVFIRSQPIVDDGQIAALKRFYKNPDGCTLVSMNPQYPPMIFNSDNCDSIQIIGLAVAKYSVIKQ